MEAALLGQWIVADPEFLQQIDSYLRSYLAWLDADPDVAAWSDIAIVVGLEASSPPQLTQEPDAVLISPFHPLRLAWQCIAQRALFTAINRHASCPAASVL